MSAPTAGPASAVAGPVGAVAGPGGSVAGPVADDPVRARLPLLLRIEKGEPDLLELGAVTAVLLQRLTAPAPETGGRARARAVARWRRPERSRDFPGPRTWQDSPR
ncbi:acyl-CoA carboxylase epsilon subunit [Streptomyces sp. NPDC002018]|uniref:acyl-CoA carboxylase epsilon subunit n=1 Tax=Streptomyces sp. NPDC002018 TaxID=3364629 RepID=UPI0036AAAF8E